MEAAGMQFSLEECWDCPVPLKALLLLFVATVFTAAAGGAVLALRVRASHLVGAILLALSALTICVAAVQLRPGIDWRWRRVSEAAFYVPWTAPPAFAVMCLSAGACFFVAYRAIESRRS